MPLLDWATTIVGFPAHHRSAVPVVALSHMACHEGLRVAERLGWFTGWIAIDQEQPLLEGVPIGKPSWVALASLFVDGRIGETQGMVGGTVRFVPAAPAHGEPPAGADLFEWANSLGRPWLELTDNEQAQWGGLTQTEIEAVLRFFVCTRPLDLDWTTCELDPASADLLRAGLFEHGWTRNGELVSSKEQVLWGGLPHRGALDGTQIHILSVIQRGLRVKHDSTRWRAVPAAGHCPLDDASGRRAPARRAAASAGAG